MRRVKEYGVFVAILFVLIYSDNAQAGDKILVAAASDLKFAMDEICTAFENTNPSIRVGVSYGSSGNFFAQIRQGAPYDVFFSADSAYPELLEKEGLTVKGKRGLYSVGSIVLWVPKGSPVNLQDGLRVVLQSEIKKLTIANPKHAPYGRAAEEALRYYGLWDTVQGKLVFGENISQAAQFVHTGAADAGIIALSLAISPRMVNDGAYWVIPAESYARLDQVCVILQRGKGRQGVEKFYTFVQGKKGKRILSRYGFILP